MWAASIQSGSYVYLMGQLFGHAVFRLQFSRFSVHDFLFSYPSTPPLSIKVMWPEWFSWFSSVSCRCIIQLFSDFWGARLVQERMKAVMCVCSTDYNYYCLSQWSLTHYRLWFHMQVVYYRMHPHGRSQFCTRTIKRQSFSSWYRTILTLYFSQGATCFTWTGYLLITGWRRMQGGDLLRTLLPQFWCCRNRPRFRQGGVSKW